VTGDWPRWLVPGQGDQGLLAKPPLRGLLKAAIPEFEQSSGVKVNVEACQESQLTTSSPRVRHRFFHVHVFMTVPLQEARLFKNGLVCAAGAATTSPISPAMS